MLIELSFGRGIDSLKRKGKYDLKRIQIVKRIGAFFMAAALVTTTIAQLNTKVYATGLPNITQFATADELKTFNTDNTDGSSSAAKVYFGENDQQWWIAGSQNGNLTLFAASSLGTKQQFSLDINRKQYDSTWDCTYVNGEPTEVYSNHYGASPIRTTLHKLETSFFTKAEQSLMNNTIIYTYDEKNNSIYSTDDKLYLPCSDPADYARDFITVGNNVYSDTNGKNVNNGLRIDKEYWSTKFWLRTAYSGNAIRAQTARPENFYGYYVYEAGVTGLYDINPAFELNSSSVLFGSAAPSAVSEGTMSLADTDRDGAFTIRYMSDALGTAEISYDKLQVNISDVPQGTYLVVQDSDGAFAKSVSGTQTISASDMHVDSFENCEVWLETTASNERMTYATMATFGAGYDVNVSASEGLTISSSNGNQKINVNNSIKDIIIDIKDGYYLPKDYLKNLQGLNGLQTIETNSGFKISGSPIKDVNIILPAATAYKDGNIVIIEPTNLTAVYGKKLSSVSLPQDWTWVDGDNSLTVGNKMYIARFNTLAYEQEYDFTNVKGYHAQGHYVERSLLVQVLKADSKVAITTSFLDKKYDGKAVQNPNVEKTGSTKDVTVTWYHRDGNDWVKLISAPVDVGTYKVVANVEADENYNGDSAELVFSISQATNEWTHELSITSWTYGEKASAPTATAKYGRITFTYSDQKNGIYTDTIPENAGTWYIKASVTGNENYTGLEMIKAFEIKKAVPQFVVPDSLTIEHGQSLSTVKLPDGFAWEDDTQTADTLGKQTFKARYTPEDTVNYLTVETNIILNVVSKNIPASDMNKTDHILQIGVKTGDSTKVIIYFSLMTVSFIVAVSSVLFRRKKQR